MNDAAKIYLGVLFRYAIVIICTKLGIDKAEQEKLIDPEAIGFLVAAALTIGYGLYRTLKSKLAQKVAAELPAGVPMSTVKAEVKEQPLSAVLTTKPVEPVTP